MDYLPRKYIAMFVTCLIVLIGNFLIVYFLKLDSLIFYLVSGGISAAFLTFISHKIGVTNQHITHEILPEPTTEENLESKQQLEEILKSINEGVILADIEGKVLLVSRKALEILQASNATISGKTVQQIFPHPIEDEKNREGFRIKYSAMTGEPIIINVKTYPYSDGNNILIGKIYIFSNITKELSLEEMKLDFVAIAAHQLRTPLTAIKGYLFLLKQIFDSEPEKFTEKEKTFLDRSIVSSEKLGSLLENLLNVSKIERGSLKIKFQKIDIKEVLQNAVEALEDKANSKKIKINVNNKAINDQIEVSGDPFLLESALSNIIDNAINYNNEGGIVNIFFSLHSDDITIHISDSGIGIPGDALPFLFTKFYSVSNSLTKLSNGLGLGLYIAKSIIDAHKGQISVNSMENKGTTVSISLPYSTPLSSNPDFFLKLPPL